MHIYDRKLSHFFFLKVNNSSVRVAIKIMYSKL